MDKRNFSGLNSAEITASVTAAANLLAAKLSDNELNLLSSVFMQFADTLATIYVVRIINSTAETDGTAQKDGDKNQNVKQN
ncbi:MAG: hypothetical protein FWG70_00105 [Oscillospiraceae bacterium]|nr:hypothetical protein [Oscillospiraceae bacterium]